LALHLVEENATSILIHINYAISKKKAVTVLIKAEKQTSISKCIAANSVRSLRK